MRPSVTAATAPGDRVALVGRNRPAYVAALYGIPAAGRIAVPLNHRLAPAEIAAQVERAGATLVIADDLPGAVPWAAWEADVAAARPPATVGGPRRGRPGLDPLHQRHDRAPRRARS